MEDDRPKGPVYSMSLRMSLSELRLFLYETIFHPSLSADSSAEGRGGDVLGSVSLIGVFPLGSFLDEDCWGGGPDLGSFFCFCPPAALAYDRFGVKRTGFLLGHSFVP